MHGLPAQKIVGWLVSPPQRNNVVPKYKIQKPMIDTIKSRFYGRLRDDILSKASDDWELTYRGKKSVCQDVELQPNQENHVLLSTVQLGVGLA